MIDPTATGIMRTGKQVTDREIGEVTVRLTRNTETKDVNGERFSFPQVELRLKIEVRREGKVVAFCQIPAAGITEGIEEFMSGYFPPGVSSNRAAHG